MVGFCQRFLAKLRGSVFFLVIAGILLTPESLLWGDELAEMACKAWNGKRVHSGCMLLKADGYAMVPTGSYTERIRHHRSANDNSPVPPADIRKPVSMFCVLDFEKHVLRFEYDSAVYNLVANAIDVEKNTLGVSTDRSQYRKRVPGVKETKSQVDLYKSTICPVETIFTHHVYPLLFCNGIVVTGESTVNYDLTTNGLNPQVFASTQAVSTPGKDYDSIVILKSLIGKSCTEFHAVPSKDWAIVRYAAAYEEKPVVQIDIKYSGKEFETPESWKITEFGFQSGTAIASYELKVIEFGKVKSFPNSFYEPTINVNDVVVDMDADEEYVNTSAGLQKVALGYTGPNDASIGDDNYGGMIFAIVIGLTFVVTLYVLRRRFVK